MKTLIPIFCLLLTASAGFAQPELKQAIDDFHYSLAFTYHPMADDGNYEPIRKRSLELVQKAQLVKAACQAAESAPKALESRIEVLAESCTALHDVISQGAADEVIYQRLSRIHDLFHEVEDAVLDWDLKR